MSHVERKRTVGHIEIIVVKDHRIFLVDPRNNRRKQITDEYHGRVVDQHLLDEIEHRVRGTHPFEDDTLLGFLRS